MDHRTVPGLNLSSGDVHFVGIGGRTVSKIFAYDLEYVIALQPEIIILEIGSNDFCEVGVRYIFATEDPIRPFRQDILYLKLS